MHITGTKQTSNSFLMLSPSILDDNTKFHIEQLGGKGDLMDYNRNLFVMDLQAACITLGCDFDPAAHTEAEIDQLYELWDKERLPMLEFAQKYICGGEESAEGKSVPGPEG